MERVKKEKELKEIQLMKVFLQKRRVRLQELEKCSNNSPAHRNKASYREVVARLSPLVNKNAHQQTADP